MTSDVVNPIDPQLIRWLNRDEQKYEPLPNQIFLLGRHRVTFEGLVLPEYTIRNNIVQYLLINRNGHL